MPADLRLVVQAAERDTPELAAQRRRHRLAQRGLTHTRRAVEAEYRGFEVALELDDGQVFEDTLLDLLEPEMVAVELLARAIQIEIVLGYLVPREFQQQLQVGHLHRIFGHGGIQPLDLLQLFLEGFADLLGPVLLLGLLAHLLDVGIGAVAQFVLDRAHLLLQVIVALLLVDLLLHALLYLVLQLGQLLFADQYFEQLAGTGQQAGGLQQRLAVFVRKLHVRADEIDDAALGVDVLDGEGRLLGHRRRDVDDVERHVADRIHEGLELDALQVGRRIAQGGHPGPEIGLGRNVFAYFDLLQAVQDHREVPVGHFEDFDDARRGADLVHVVRRGVFDVALALQHGAQDAAFGIHGTQPRLMLLSRPTVIGVIAPGKSTELRSVEDRDDFRHFDLLGDLVAAGHDRNHVVFAVEQLGKQARIFDFDGFDYLIFFTHSLQIQIYNGAKVTIFYRYLFYL